jgi:hypothetical protein
MRTRRTRFSKVLTLVAIVSIAGTRRSPAVEAYVIGFLAESSVAYGSCSLIFWTPDLILHNAGTQDARVRLLGLSNNIQPSLTTEIVVPSHRTRSGLHLLGQIPGGQLPFLWVAKLDIPEGIVAQSRVEASPSDCGHTRPPEPPSYGAFSLPITRSLTPPNSTKVHLAADLGSQNTYVNVGVYNASVEPAHATVELRQACDDALLDQRTIAIPGNTIVQLGGLDGPLTSCETGATLGSAWVRYVNVTVDQPSLSYVISKMNELPNPPRIPYGSSCNP